MNMTNLKFNWVALTLTFLFSWAIAGENGSTYKVSTEKSTLTWKGKKVTGAHHGKINLKSGTLSSDGNKLTGGLFEIDVTSITNEDLTDETYNAKLVNHLKSDDFFSAEKFPIATIEITSAQQISGDKYDIKGNLTIKGITHEINFPATIKITDKNIAAVAKIIVDRSLFDVRYGSTSFFEGLGDKAIDNNFEIDVALAAIK